MQVRLRQLLWVNWDTMLRRFAFRTAPAALTASLHRGESTQQKIIKMTETASNGSFMIRSKVAIIALAKEMFIVLPKSA